MSVLYHNYLDQKIKILFLCFLVLYPKECYTVSIGFSITVTGRSLERPIRGNRKKYMRSCIRTGGWQGSVKTGTAAVL